MKRTCKIILFEEHPSVNFYTVQFVNEGTSETEKFFSNYSDDCKYDQDIDVIISWEQTLKTGCLCGLNPIIN